MKTPEQMAEEYGASPQEKDAFLAGYQAAKDTYKEAISAYEDVAKQMLEEAVRIMSPKDQLADADKVVTNMEAFAEVLYADMPVAKEAFLRGYKQTKAKLNTIQPQWISVKERLPEIPDNRWMSDDVLWLTRYGEMEVSCLERLHSEFRVDWGDAGLLELDKFTHWMPLPEPPKEEK